MASDYAFIILAAIGFGIIGFGIIVNDADSIQPTNAYSRVMTHTGFVHSKSYNDVLYLNYPYAQISDLTTQATIQGQAKNVTLNTNDSIYKITHSISSKTNEIKIQESGIYLVIAVPQVGQASGQAEGVHDFWMMKNNIQVPNSNIKTNIMIQLLTGDTMTGTLNWVGYLSTGDIISFQQSSDDSDIGIVFTASGVAPATPSIIISIAKIAE